MPIENNDFSSSSNPYSRQIGNKINNINAALAAGSITSVEAKDLLNDMKIAQELALGAVQLEEKILIQQSIDIIIDAISLVI